MTLRSVCLETVYLFYYYYYFYELFIFKVIGMPEVNKTESKGLEGLESNIKKWEKKIIAGQKTFSEKQSV